MDNVVTALVPSLLIGFFILSCNKGNNKNLDEFEPKEESNSDC